MKVRLKEIADRTGYSINTISRALKEKGDIAESTRKLIIQAAKEMGYIPNGIASGLRSGLTRTIAVILSDVANPYFSIMAKHIETEARKFAYAVFVLNSGESQGNEEQAIRLAINKGVDGMILFPVQGSSGSIDILNHAHIPYLLVGRHFENADCDYLISDDIRGGFLATDHLIAKGAERILFLNGPCYMSCSRERETGYRNALVAHGMTLDPSLIVHHEITMGNTYSTMKELIRQRRNFDGIFAFSDLVAWEAIYAMLEEGIRIPQDIKVVGYDNIQSELLCPFPLTTINIAKEKIAARAVAIILEKIQGETEPRLYREVFETILIERHSC